MANKVFHHITTWYTLCVVVNWFYQVVNLLATSYDIAVMTLILRPQPGTDFPEELMIVPQCV